MRLDKDDHLMASCWVYALSQFHLQAHRFALVTKLPPREAREVLAKLHHFSGWQGLSNTLTYMHDIALCIELENPAGRADARTYLSQTSVLLSRLSTLDAEDEKSLASLEEALSAAPEVVTVDPSVAPEDDSAQEGWEVFQQFKAEIAHRCVWKGDLEYGLPRSPKHAAIIVDLAAALIDHRPDLLPSETPTLKTACDLVSDFYHGREIDQETIDAALDYEDDPGDKRAPPSLESLGLKDHTWVRARTLLRALGYKTGGWLDQTWEDWPSMALLSHAPDDAMVHIHTDDGTTAALWGEIIVREARDLERVGFLAAGLPNYRGFVSADMALDDIKDPTKAGWLHVQWS